MSHNTLKDVFPPETARRLKNTGRQDKLSHCDSRSVSGIDFRDPRDLQSAQQLLCWHKPEDLSGACPSFHLECRDGYSVHLL